MFIIDDLYKAFSKTHRKAVETVVSVFKTCVEEYKKSLPGTHYHNWTKKEMEEYNRVVARNAMEVLNDLKSMDKKTYRTVTILYEKEIAEIKRTARPKLF